MVKSKIFIAYRFTGEDKEEVRKTISNVCSSLKKAGFDYYSTIFDSAQFENELWSGDKIMKKAFKEIDDSDYVLFFVKDDRISEGMILELGYCLAKNKNRILAINKNIEKSIFRRHIEKIIEFDNLSDLYVLLSNLKV